MKVADALVEALIQSGVTTVFGLPGDTGVALYDAMARAYPRIKHVLARDERHAATMADAYARVSGRLAAVEASSGGGATFLVGGLGEALAASIPMLVLTTDVARRSRGTDAITEIDQSLLFAAVTKWRTYVDNEHELLARLAEALDAARSGRPGPVHLVLPEDLLDVEIEGPVGLPQRCAIPAARPQPDAAEVHKAARHLDRAERPVIVVGGGVHLSGAYEALAAVAHVLQAPVATTIHGKGAFCEDDPLSLGVVGANGADRSVNAAIGQADVALLIGTRANSTDTDGFRAPSRAATVIRADIDEAQLQRNYVAAATLHGDAREALALLLDALHALPARERPAIPAAVDRPAHTAAAAIIEATQSLFPDALAVGDAGTPTPHLAAFWRVHAPSRSVILPRGHGAMGYAIPAAIGMAIASPGRRVLCFTTDGSFAMACGELETMVRYRLPITLIHFSNGTYGWIKMLQHLYMDRRYFSVDFGGVDAVRVSQGFGLAAARALDPSALVTAIRALPQDGPVLIDVPVPSEQDDVPPVAPWQSFLSGASSSRPVY